MQGYNMIKKIKRNNDTSTYLIKHDYFIIPAMLHIEQNAKECDATKAL